MKNLFIVLTLLPLFVFGQEKAKTNNPYSIDVIFASDTHLPPAGIDGGPAIYQVSAYRVGINVLYDLGKNTNWSLRTGLRYAVYNQRREADLSLSDPTRLGIVTSYQKVIFYELPLFLRYKIGKKRLKLYGEGGIGIDYAPSENQNTHPFWGLSCGLEYHFNSRIGVFTQPIFRKYNRGNNIHFTSTGIEMGINLKFS